MTCMGDLRIPSTGLGRAYARPDICCALSGVGSREERDLTRTISQPAITGKSQLCHARVMAIIYRVSRHAPSDRADQLGLGHGLCNRKPWPIWQPMACNLW